MKNITVNDEKLLRHYDLTECTVEIDGERVPAVYVEESDLDYTQYTDSGDGYFSKGNFRMDSIVFCDFPGDFPETEDEAMDLINSEDYFTDCEILETIMFPD